MPSLKVETPGHLDGMFSLDCFKFNEMKGIFHHIYEHLELFGERLELHELKFANIPDFSKLERNIRDLEKQTVANTKAIKILDENF